MTEAESRKGVLRTVAGLVLIVVAAPAYIRLIPGYKGWTVILGGVAALGVLIAGVALAGHWLGCSSGVARTLSSSRGACSCW